MVRGTGLELKMCIRDRVKKVNAGEELTWEDLDSANWSVMGNSSPAGYIYPCLLYTSRCV